LEAKKTELLRKIRWPQKSIQRIFVCVDAYETISAVDPEHQPAFFQWFLETADAIWFTNPPQEQDDSSKRKRMLNQVFGEADAAKLLELLQNDPSETLSDEAGTAVRPIPPDAELLPADITRCRAKYTRSVTGLIDWYSNEGYPTQKYYDSLLTAFNALLSSCTAEEKGICLYTILLDKRTPYHEVPKGFSMSRQEYRDVAESIMPSIQKMRYILALRNTYPTEPVSQLLFVLEGLKTSEEKIVFLSELMGEMQPDEDN